jgi:uncharacterized protein YukE
MAQEKVDFSSPVQIKLEEGVELTFRTFGDVNEWITNQFNYWRPIISVRNSLPVGSTSAVVYQLTSAIQSVVDALNEAQKSPSEGSARYLVENAFNNFKFGYALSREQVVDGMDYSHLREALAADDINSAIRLLTEAVNLDPHELKSEQPDSVFVQLRNDMEAKNSEFSKLQETVGKLDSQLAKLHNAWAASTELSEILGDISKVQKEIEDSAESVRQTSGGVTARLE